jgi:flavodoxin
MKSLVIYDSQYGNTEKIAKAIAKGLGKETEITVVSELNLEKLKGVDLLVVGSPTHGGRPTEGIQKFIKEIPKNGLENTKVAAFDTRIEIIVLKLIGFAAGRIAKSLTAKGGKLVGAEGFVVQGTEGPLKDGELERASEWAKSLGK